MEGHLFQLKSVVTTAVNQKCDEVMQLKKSNMITLKEKEDFLQKIDLKAMEDECSALRKPKTEEELKVFQQKHQEVSAQLTKVIESLTVVKECGSGPTQTVEDFNNDVEKTLQDAERFILHTRDCLTELKNNVGKEPLVQPTLEALCAKRHQEVKDLQGWLELADEALNHMSERTLNENKESKDPIASKSASELEVQLQNQERKNDAVADGYPSLPNKVTLPSWTKPIKGVPRSEWPHGVSLDDGQVRALHETRHEDPAFVLGWHQIGDQAVIRVWHGGLEEEGDVSLILGHYDKLVPLRVPMERRCAWLYEVMLEDATAYQPQDRYYYVEVTRPGQEPKRLYDPYAYSDVLPDEDILKFKSGFHPKIHDKMGCHCIEVNGIFGLRFTVWAPRARHMTIVSDFNAWDYRAHPMKRRFIEHQFTGVWELFVPFGMDRSDVPFGKKYNFKIRGAHGNDFVKFDPFARQSEVPPLHASVISESLFGWSDDEWLQKRKALAEGDQFRRQPMAIYEVHLPSWKRTQDGNYLNFKELAPMLIQHMKEMNFNWLELMPCAHHPFAGSWGYQVTGQFAIYSQLGTPDDFKFFIDAMHKADIGVLMDYVPAHFCKDEWALSKYDGSATFEYEDPREGEHKEWGTWVFNFKSNEVRSFLIGAPIFWVDEYHIDGFRVDAVSAMLYRDYNRKDGQWIRNEHGGNSNLEAVSLLREMNTRMNELWPGVIMSAEESTSWSGVTKGLEEPSGLGFHFKWDMGWMNDTLSYLSAHSGERPGKHDKLTFRGVYMPHEKWVLPLSHDEVVHGKGSLVDKMNRGNNPPYYDKIRLLKALYGYQVASPGRPLLFMGGEFAQGREWNHAQSLDWHETNNELQNKICTWVSDLMAVYQHFKPLHAGDDEPYGAEGIERSFDWTEPDNRNASVIAFARRWEQKVILFVGNFSYNQYPNYAFGVPIGGQWKVILNSDNHSYGGQGFGPMNGTDLQTTPEGRWGWPACLTFDVPALSCLILQGPEPCVSVPDVPQADAPMQDEPANPESKS